MKTLKNFTLCALVLLTAVSCRKEGGFDGRSKRVTHGLRTGGKNGRFIVQSIITPAQQIDLRGGYGTSYMTMSFGNETKIQFLPDSSQNLRRQYWGDPWNKYELGDTQDVYLEYTFLHNLVIKIPIGGTQSLVIVKGREQLPMADIAGEYEVEAGHTFNGRPGYKLVKYGTYDRHNGISPPITIIELAEPAQ